MREQPRLVVLGILGRTPFAGVAWQVLHYLEGFRRLGLDVYYAEDTGDWPYDAEQNTITDDCSFTVRYIARLMEWCGMSDRWAYRSGATGEWYGMPKDRVSSLFEGADALINLTGATVLRDEYLRVPVRIYLETDPVLPQIEVAKGHAFTIDVLSAHTHFFTYGENLGAPDSVVPVGRFSYHPTRQPVVLDWWTPVPLARSGGDAEAPRFTTIASWKQSGKDIEWNGETYLWSKHLEFLKFIDAPARTDTSLEVALACSDPDPIQLLESHGWRVINAVALSKDILPYREYIRGSRGEFTIAKDQYVRTRSGWFSDRSACFLAAGRPVITQETGFSKILPTGRGLFGFSTMEDVAAAMEEIESDYEGHCRAAREIAVECFAAEKVLGELLDRAGLPGKVVP